MGANLISDKLRNQQHPDNIEIPPCWKELMTLNFYKSETYKTLQEKEKGL